MFDACKCVHAVWDHPQRTSALRGGEENKNMTIVCSDKLRDWHSDKRGEGGQYFCERHKWPDRWIETVSFLLIGIARYACFTPILRPPSMTEWE